MRLSINVALRRSYLNDLDKVHRFMIPYGCQNINDADIQAVVNVMKSEFLTQGPVLPEFERRLAAYCDAKSAVGANSATSALHLACMALGVKAGDRVWSSPITFVASTNAALYCGAQVDFVDIDPKTYNMCPDRLAEKLAEADKNGVLPKVVIPVHLSGQSCDMKSIGTLAQKYGFKVIEDASHAIGGSYLGKKIGGCQYSDITIFSFHPVKIITAGEGGIALTNQPELAATMARLRSHGVTRTPSEMDKAPDGPWYYQQIDLGYNYRMTEIQAALVLSQLDRLDTFVAGRHDRAARYDRLFGHDQIITPWQHPDAHSAYHLYIIGLKEMPYPSYRKEVFERLRAAGVGVNLHYIPVYHHPYYKNMGFLREEFPVAEAFYAQSITLPLFPDLTDAQQDHVRDALREPIGFQTLF